MSDTQIEEQAEVQTVTVNGKTFELNEELKLEVKQNLGNEVLLRDVNRIAIPVNFLTGYTDIPLIPGDAYFTKAYYGFAPNGDLYVSDDEEEVESGASGASSSQGEGQDEFTVIPESEKAEADKAFQEARIRWQLVKTSGMNPPPVSEHTCTKVGDSLVVFGGRRGVDEETTNTVYQLDIESSTWTRQESCGDVPPPMAEHTATLVGDLIYVFGGKVATKERQEASSDVYTLDPSSMMWTRVETSGNYPSPRYGHTATLSPDGTSLIVIGGADSKNVFNDVYLLDVNSHTWTMAHVEEDAVVPEPFYNHTAVLYDGKVVVTGGVRPMLLGTMYEYLFDAWAYNVDTKAWEGPLGLSNAPGFSARSMATASLFEPVAVYVGGQGRFFEEDKVAFADLANNRWISLPVGGVHRPGRHGHTANVVGNQIWLFGGKQGSDDLYDITVLDFSGMFGDGSVESLGMAITQSVGGVDKEEDDKDGKGKEVAADEDVVEIEG